MHDGDHHLRGPRRDLRSFGRKRGRKLSAHQAQLLKDELPRRALDLTTPAPNDIATLFPSPVREVWLEIGFGGAEHMIWQARETPNAGIIGCEPFEEGVVKALAAIEAGNLSNIRIHADDARPLLRWLPDRSLARAFVLFPDPWPKKRHQKRRLVSRETLQFLARVLRPGAELRFATDIGDYARTALFSIMENKAFGWLADGPSDWRVRPADWPETRYERKALREGRKPYYFRFRRL
jgi:tRNA (guanine-N7-)-methyltransferase